MKLLEKISSDDFIVRMAPAFNTFAFYRMLRQSNEFTELEKAIKYNFISDEVLENYIDNLLEVFERRQRFKYDTTLALIAICLEKHMTAFAKKYIEELSALSIYAELPNSPEIAQICLKNRNKLIYCDSKTFSLDILPQLYEGMTRIDSRISAGLDIVDTHPQLDGDMTKVDSRISAGLNSDSCEAA